jgi:hypothetical protein
VVLDGGDGGRQPQRAVRAHRAGHPRRRGDPDGLPLGLGASDQGWCLSAEGRRQCSPCRRAGVCFRIQAELGSCPCVATGKIIFFKIHRALKNMIT